MASTKIRGITIEIGGDTSGLNKALSDSNKEIRNTQTQLRDVEKLLKLDPGSVELLSQKQELLNRKVEETSSKLDTLKKAEQQLRESGVDQNSAQFQALQREILSTEQYLKDAKKEAESFSVGLEKARASFDGVSQKAEIVAQKTAGISAIAAGAVVGLGGMAVKAMQASDELNTLAKQSGFTTEELQKFEYASEMVDVSTENITGAVTKMRRNMDSTSTDVQEAWQRLGISVTDVEGNMRDSSEVFYETLDALSKVGNETERDQLAMQLFGRSADQLAGIIDDGGEALRAFGEQAEATGKIWSQESIDAANAANDIIDTLKADVSQTILITGAKALEALTPVIEKASDAVGGLLTWIGELDTETLEAIIIVGTVVASISPIAGIISSISGAVSTFLSLVPKIQAAFTAVTAFAAANPIVVIAAAVVAAVAIIIKNWDKIKQWSVDTWNAVKTKLIDPLVDGFNRMKDKVGQIWDAIIEHVQDRINGLVDKVNLVIQTINGLSTKLNNSGLGQALGINIGQITPLAHVGSDTLTTTTNYTAGSSVNSYNFSVNDINTYQQIEQKILNQRQSQRMGYVGG